MAVHFVYKLPPRSSGYPIVTLDPFQFAPRFIRAELYEYHLQKTDRFPERGTENMLVIIFHLIR
jgi:hypothetical protein